MGSRDGQGPGRVQALSSWEDKIASAMRICKQDKHLIKDGVLVGMNYEHTSSYKVHTNTYYLMYTQFIGELFLSPALHHSNHDKKPVCISVYQV
jgi:hypothetical protein